jgi:hypothetical protein
MTPLKTNVAGALTVELPYNSNEGERYWMRESILRKGGPRFDVTVFSGSRRELG